MYHVVNIKTLKLLASYYSLEGAVARAGDEPDVELFEGVRRQHLKALLEKAAHEGWTVEQLRTELEPLSAELEQADASEERDESTDDDQPPQQPEYHTEPEGPTSGQQP